MPRQTKNAVGDLQNGSIITLHGRQDPSSCFKKPVAYDDHNALAL